MSRKIPTPPFAFHLVRIAGTALFAFFLLLQSAESRDVSFEIMETTIEQVHDAYRSGSLTARKLVETYLRRIEAYDQNGPRINAIITIDPSALEQADRLDAAFGASGFVGPLHGIPVLLKDQVDTVGMPTTLGSVLFADYYPDRDAFVTVRLKAAGAIILGKTTLGELAGGDTHGSLFGSTRNPYDPERTAGGSSGGSAASLAANFTTVAVGQEGLASIRRPSAWNGIVGMRPTAGLVSRNGVFGGWPEVNGSLGPMARTVADLARLLDVMVAYDPEDPLTARGATQVPESYQQFLDRQGLQGARLGILREPMGVASEPESEDFAKVSRQFDQSVGELEGAGAIVIDPVVIPGMKAALATLVSNYPEIEEGFRLYFSRSISAPFGSLEEMRHSPDFEKIPRTRFARDRMAALPQTPGHYEYLKARDELMVSVLKVMADHRLDALVYKAVEHQPTLIRDGTGPPFFNGRGASYLNTFLVYVPALVVPAGFTSDGLPVGITFMGRPYDDGRLLRYAYAYEQATRHRRPPDTTPALRNGNY